MQGVAEEFKSISELCLVIEGFSRCGKWDRSNDPPSLTPGMVSDHMACRMPVAVAWRTWRKLFSGTSTWCRSLISLKKPKYFSDFYNVSVLDCVSRQPEYFHQTLKQSMLDINRFDMVDLMINNGSIPAKHQRLDIASYQVTPYL